MTDCAAAGQAALACYQCVCLTWESLIGLVLPALVAVVYLPRIVSEMTLDDLLIGLFAAVFTYADRVISDDGIAHVSWMTYITVLWAIQSCTTDRIASLRSLPMIWFLVFVTIAIPDVISALHLTPAGRIAAPGGGGLADGLVVKPVLALAVNAMMYWLKVHPVLPNKRRRGKAYDAVSREFLLNPSPLYRRPVGMDARLVLVGKSA